MLPTLVELTIRLVHNEKDDLGTSPTRKLWLLSHNIASYGLKMGLEWSSLKGKWNRNNYLMISSIDPVYLLRMSGLFEHSGGHTRVMEMNKIRFRQLTDRPELLTWLRSGMVRKTQVRATFRFRIHRWNASSAGQDLPSSQSWWTTAFYC